MPCAGNPLWARLMESQFPPRWSFHSGGLSKEQKGQNQQIAHDVWMLSMCPSPDPFSTLLCVLGSCPVTWRGFLLLLWLLLGLAGGRHGDQKKWVWSQYNWCHGFLLAETLRVGHPPPAWLLLPSGPLYQLQLLSPSSCNCFLHCSLGRLRLLSDPSPRPVLH